MTILQLGLNAIHALRWRAGNVLRGAIARAELAAMGSGTLVLGRLIVHGGERISVGDMVTLGDQVTLSGALGTLTLGRRCAVLDGVELLSEGQVSIGSGTTLNKDSVVRGEIISLGADVWVARNCIIEGRNINIGARVILGPFVHINDGMHRIDPETQAILMEPGISRPIAIGENAWIGSGAMILGGVHIGRGAIIGARSVVRDDVPEFCVAVGNPARVVKNRLTGERIGLDK